MLHTSPLFLSAYVGPVDGDHDHLTIGNFGDDPSFGVGGVLDNHIGKTFNLLRDSLRVTSITATMRPDIDTRCLDVSCLAHMDAQTLLLIRDLLHAM